MRTASVRSSANDPSPEPRTSPICGRSSVCESTNAAADSARVKRSSVIENHVGAGALACPAGKPGPRQACFWLDGVEKPGSALELLLKFRERLLQLPLQASTLIRPNKLLTFSRSATARRFF